MPMPGKTKRGPAGAVKPRPLSPPSNRHGLAFSLETNALLLATSLEKKIIVHF
jgi:hypothetical protein